MLPNFYDKLAPQRWWLAIGPLLWVVFGFGISYFVVRAIVQAAIAIGVPLDGINPSVFSAVTAAGIYSTALLIVIGVPWWLKKRPTTKADIGLARLPTWLDLGLAPAGFVVYLLLSAIVMYGATQLIPGFNANETQDVGFAQLTRYFEYLLAFITLVIIAPIAEEVLFRGYLYGKLRKLVPVWLAIVLVSVLFAAIHGRWNVAIDVFVLSVVMCSLREMTGSIWTGIILHMMKNGLAFYLVFINPAILHTIGG
jgi:membrane protease YdiL (CAAX protease family)